MQVFILNTHKVYEIFLVCYALSFQGILMQRCLCSEHAHGRKVYKQQSCALFARWSSLPVVTLLQVLHKAHKRNVLRNTIPLYIHEMFTSQEGCIIFYRNEHLLHSQQGILTVYENYHLSLPAAPLCAQQASGWPTLIQSMSRQDVEAYSCQIKYGLCIKTENITVSHGTKGTSPP